MKSTLQIFAVVMLLMVTGFSYGQVAGVPDGTYSCEQRASTGKPHIITMVVTTTAGVSTVAYRETIDGLEICTANLVYVRTEPDNHYIYKSAVEGSKDCTGGVEMHFIATGAGSGVMLQKGGSGRTFNLLKQ